MTTYTLTPAVYPVFNELDQFGLLLSLPRLASEGNAAYKQRLMDVMVHRASSDYQGLVYGITRELGLSIADAVTIAPVTDGDGNFLVTFPAVVFENTKCTLYSNYITETVLLEIDRFEPLQGAFDLQGLVDTINATGYFTATLNGDSSMRSMCIFNQSSVGSVTSEDIGGGGLVIRLENTNLVPGTIAVTSSNLTIRKASSSNLQSGEYYVDETTGTIFSAQVPEDGSIIRYRHHIDSFVAKSSPVILHNLQSADFKTKMFETVTDENGDSQLGLPTGLGADIVNELLSVYPSLWGS